MFNIHIRTTLFSSKYKKYPLNNLFAYDPIWKVNDVMPPPKMPLDKHQIVKEGKHHSKTEILHAYLKITKQ